MVKLSNNDGTAEMDITRIPLFDVAKGVAYICILIWYISDLRVAITDDLGELQHSFQSLQSELTQIRADVRTLQNFREEVLIRTGDRFTKTQADERHYAVMRRLDKLQRDVMHLMAEHHGEAVQLQKEPQG